MKFHFFKKNNLKKPYIININSTVSPGSFQDEFIPFMENRELKIMMILHLFTTRILLH